MGDVICLAAACLFCLVWLGVASFRWLSRPRPGESLAGNRLKCCLLFLLLGALLVGLLLPASGRVRESPRHISCKNNLRQLVLALANYESSRGRLPPAYSVDKNGRPLHSWRVLLLPYLECEGLYKQIRLDEPWDSPHNKAVFDATPMPRVLACPVEEHERGKDDLKQTSYVMVVGPGTISDGPNSARLKDVRDGSTNTIAVVEMSDSGIHWAEPRDLNAAEMSYRIDDPDEPSIRSRHAGGANVAFCDGTVRFAVDSIPPELIKALTTVAGGEDVREFWEAY